MIIFIVFVCMFPGYQKNRMPVKALNCIKPKTVLIFLAHYKVNSVIHMIAGDCAVQHL